MTDQEQTDELPTVSERRMLREASVLGTSPTPDLSPDDMKGLLDVARHDLVKERRKLENLWRWTEAIMASLHDVKGVEEVVPAINKLRADLKASNEGLRAAALLDATRYLVVARINQALGEPADKGATLIGVCEAIERTATSRNRADEAVEGLEEELGECMQAGNKLRFDLLRTLGMPETIEGDVVEMVCKVMARRDAWRDRAESAEREIVRLKKSSGDAQEWLHGHIKKGAAVTDLVHDDLKASDEALRAVMHRESRLQGEFDRVRKSFGIHQGISNENTMRVLVAWLAEAHNRLAQRGQLLRA